MIMKIDRQKYYERQKSEAMCLFWESLKISSFDFFSEKKNHLLKRRKISITNSMMSCEIVKGTAT